MKAKSTNEYFLMHKNIPVCLMEITSDGLLRKYKCNPEASDHLPLGGQMNDMKFHDWWNNRAIPKTRNGAKSALQRLGYATTNSALVDNLALSLSDCYWIKPRDEALLWEDVNLYTNNFIDTFGELTINIDQIIDLRNATKFRFATSQGELQKKWCIDQSGKRYMVKGNYGQSYQQSLNELFATRLHRQLGFENHTEYSLTKLKTESDIEGIGCISYDFCNENIESISAWEILQTVKYRQNESYYMPFKKACISLGMDEESFNHFMDYEIMTDYLISNTDRHMNNISVLRNPDTLELIGFAPIYDSGNSMFYNIPFNQMSGIDLDNITTHSFVEKESKLLSYVHDRSIVDLEKTEMTFDIYEKDLYERHIRIPRLKELYNRKRQKLADFQAGKDIWKKI